MNLALHELKSAVGLDGWTNAAVRKLAQINRPYLSATRHHSRPTPPENQGRLRAQDLANFDVKYPNPNSNISIPDEFILPAVREFRKNLEHAISLEKELGSHGLEIVIPLEPDLDRKGDSLERTHGISAVVLFYVGLFKRLTDQNPECARTEALTWPTDDETVFARLRIWAGGDPRIYAASDVGQLLCGLSDRTFWQGRNQRDLLLVVAKRWPHLLQTHKTRLEARTLQGPPRWGEEGDAEYAEHSAGHSLTRIHWLKSHGCEFGFDFLEVDSKLRQRASGWQPHYANNAVASMEGRGGWVTTNTDYSALLNVPVGGLLDRAKELSGRTSDFLAETNPYAGLSVERPVRAFAALAKSAKLNVYPEWAWKTFLNSDGRKSDKPKLCALIAEHVSRMPNHTLVSLVHSVFDSFRLSSALLLQRFPELFDRVWTKLISAIESDSESDSSKIIRSSSDSDWSMEALNSPVGETSAGVDE